MPRPPLAPVLLFVRKTLCWMIAGAVAELFDRNSPETLFWMTLLKIFVPDLLGAMTMPAPVASLPLVVHWTVKPTIVTPLAFTLTPELRDPSDSTRPVTMVSAALRRALERASTPAWAPRTVN